MQSWQYIGPFTVTTTGPSKPSKNPQHLSRGLERAQAALSKFPGQYQVYIGKVSEAHYIQSAMQFTSNKCFHKLCWFILILLVNTLILKKGSRI